MIKCRTEKLRMLQEDLQSALRQIDELKARNRELEAKLLMAGTGNRYNAHKTKGYEVCGSRWLNIAQRWSRTCR